MARVGDKTKNSVRLSVNLSKTLSKQLEDYCYKVGWTKTTAVERILTSYLKDKSHQ